MKVDVSLEAWLALSLTRGLGGEGARQLLKEFGSPEAVIAASTSSLKSVVKPEVAAEIGKGYANEAIAPTLAWLEDSNNHIVTLADSDYPQALLNITDPPLLLYVKGRLDLLNQSALAVVGSRNATPQGIHNAEAFAKSLSDAGLCIISGMAHGIDAAAHRGALQGRGSSIGVVGTGLDKVYPAANRDLAHELAARVLWYVRGRLDLLNHSALAMVGSRNATPQGIVNAEAFAKSFSAAGLCIISGMAHGIDAAAHRGALRGQGSSIAVIGTGLDKVYPAANRDLAHALAQQGALISEFPLGTPPLPANFPRRNRIISGMSLGCLVVEASLQSGSLITARLALEQGRDVFAVPGSIHAPQSKGCHALLKQGAKLVESAQDILEELGGLLITPSLNSVTQGIDIQGTDYALLEHLGFDPVDVETLRVRSGLTIAELSAMLLTLELSGHVSTIPGGLYQRIH